jgi:cytochrome bd-type quinol oxidase subunit 2
MTRSLCIASLEVMPYAFSVTTEANDRSRRAAGDALEDHNMSMVVVLYWLLVCTCTLWIRKRQWQRFPFTSIALLFCLPHFFLSELKLDSYYRKQPDMELN